MNEQSAPSDIRRLRNIADALPVLISEVDADQRYRFVNKPHEDWFGIRRADIIGKRIVDVIGEQAYAELEGSIRRALAGERVTIERYLPFRTGGARQVRLEYVPSESGGIYALIQEIGSTKRVQAELEEARRRAEADATEKAAILAQLAEGVIVTDAEGRITFVNEAARRLHGVASLGVAPDDYSETYHLFTEDGRPHPPEQLPLARAVRGETIAEARWRIRRPDGSEVLAIGGALPVRDDAGRQVGAVLTARDDTARDAAEREVRESEARLRTLTDHLPGGMVYQVWTDPAGQERRFLFVSQSVEQLAGITAEAVLADAAVAYGMIVPEDLPAVIAAEETAIQTRTPFDAEVRFRHASGQLRWARIISAPREQPDGSLIWDGIQIDITEQKRAEAALRESQAQFQAIANSIDQMVWSTRPDGYHDYFNQRWYDYTGMPEGMTDGDAWNDMFHPEDRDRAWEVWRHSLETGEPYRIEYRLRHRSGAYRWVLGRAQPVRGDDGAVTRWFGTCTEIEDLIAAREVLARSREELERRVSERTAELEQAHEQLRQSQKLEAMGQLTGGVAHDFNNLLTPIIGSLDLLQRRATGDTRERKLIDGALQSAERAKTLVQRLLAFARRQPLQPTAVDVASLIAGMAELVASTTGPQIRVVIDAADDLPPATADQNQLEMAVLNLSVNARDAMPDGGTLRISANLEHVADGASSGLAAGDYIRLSVADTGTGMDEATRSRAVEPFFSTKGIGKGTGLGLSMAHGLASQLGGALTISSRPGLGTNVELWLPASNADAPTEARGPAPALTPYRRGTVLLVDDEDLVRMSSADMLADLGYEVVEARSAEEALRLLGDGLNIDLLVSDHLMPGLSGVELAREVLQRPERPAVLIISGFADVDGIDPDLPRLTKPFRQNDLAAMLAEIGATAASKGNRPNRSAGA